MLAPEHLHLLNGFGYAAVALAVGIENVGIPLPGETTLLAAAIYAGTTHQLNIAGVIAAAWAGTILGGTVGYWLGHSFGLWLLLRFGRYIRITEARLRLGQYLFLRHGGKVVFFGRFLAVLRALAAFLAGANRMDVRRFLIFNAAGGIVWAGGYGTAAYLLGNNIRRVMGPLGLALGAAAAVLAAALLIFFHRNEERLAAEARRALPGPLFPAHPPRRR